MSGLEANSVLQNRYRIVRPIGQGGFGAVYEAVDERLSRRVAVKQMLRVSDRLSRQFALEAQLLANLTHPALPRVTDHFSDPLGQFLVMDYIPGPDLADDLMQRPTPFPVEQVVRWADQLLDVLSFLHTQTPPVIHRDIKPQNLKLTTRGDILLLDFGLAKGFAGEQQPSTLQSSIMAYTKGFAPPEQVESLGTDARSDLYSLAATLYCLLTNVPPPDAQTRLLAVARGRVDPLRPTHEGNPAVPVAVSQVLGQALALEPDERPRDAQAMRTLLQDALAGRLPPQNVAGTSEPTVIATGMTAVLPPTGPKLRQQNPPPVEHSWTPVQPVMSVQPASPMAQRPKRKLAWVFGGVAGVVVLAAVIAALVITSGGGRGRTGNGGNQQASATAGGGLAVALVDTTVAAASPTAPVAPTSTFAPTLTPTDTLPPTIAPTDTLPPTIAPTDTLPPTTAPTDTSRPTSSPTRTQHPSPTPRPTNTPQPTVTDPPTPTELPPTATSVIVPVRVLPLKQGLTVIEQGVNAEGAFRQRRIIGTVEANQVQMRFERDGAQPIDAIAPDLEANGTYLGETGSAPWVARSIWRDLAGHGTSTLRVYPNDQSIPLRLTGRTTLPVPVDGVKLDLPVLIAENSKGDVLWILDDPYNPYVLSYNDRLGYIRNVIAIQTVLTAAYMPTNTPVPSTDASTLAFAIGDNATRSRIYTMAAMPNALPQLLKGSDTAEWYNPVWSPDGREIAFISGTNSKKPNERRDLWIMDADGGNARVLEGGTLLHYYPTWSPDGSQIAFTGTDKTKRVFHVFVINRDGSNQRDLGMGGNPQWAADGTILFTYAGAGGLLDIWSIRADGTGRTNLSNTPDITEEYASLSPDFSHIVYVANIGTDLTTRQIWVCAPDGSNPQQLTSGKPSTDPLWSPDGSQIAFVSRQTGPDWQIWVMNKDGSGSQQLTFDAGAKFYLSWKR